MQGKHPPSLHPLLLGHPSLLCSGSLVGKVVVGRLSEGTVSIVQMNPLPAASGGKCLQEKGEPNGRGQGMDDRSLTGYSELWYPVTQYLGPVLVRHAGPLIYRKKKS